MVRQKPKIAVLVNSFWNGGSGGLSGGDQRAIQIFRRINERLDITFFTSSEGALAIRRELNVARFVVSPEKFDKKGVIFAYSNRTKWLNRILLRESFDIIYSSSDFLPDVIPAYRYKIKHPKTKWIQLIHHLYPVWYRRPGNKIVNIIAQFSQRYSLALIKKFAEKIINVSYEVKNALVKRGFSSNKIVINPNGVDFQLIESVKQKPSRKLRAIFVGRLNYSKGIFDLIEIWKTVINTLPTAVLQVVGGGEPAMVDKLKSEICAANLTKNIKLCGFMSMSEKDTIRKMKASDLFVFPSHEEGFGIAIAEAMACRLPAISWDLSVYKEVFPEGLVRVKLGDFQGFAKAVVDILKNPGEADILAEKGYKLIRKYSWDSVAETELKIISKE